MERSIDIYDAVIRENRIFLDNVRLADIRTRAALTEMIQIVQEIDKPSDKKGNLLHLLQSTLFRMEENTKEIDSMELLTIKSIRDMYENNVEELSKLKIVFDHVRIHQNDDEIEAMMTWQTESKSTIAKNRVEDLSSTQQVLFRAMTSLHTKKIAEAREFESVLSEVKKSIEAGSNTIERSLSLLKLN